MSITGTAVMQVGTLKEILKLIGRKVVFPVISGIWDRANCAQRGRKWGVSRFPGVPTPSLKWVPKHTGMTCDGGI